jgi:hypothetical protein
MARTSPAMTNQSGEDLAFYFVPDMARLVQGAKQPEQENDWKRNPD